MLHVQFLPFEKARCDWGVAKENVQLSNPNKAVVLEFLAVLTLLVNLALRCFAPSTLP